MNKNKNNKIQTKSTKKTNYLNKVQNRHKNNIKRILFDYI